MIWKKLEKLIRENNYTNRSHYRFEKFMQNKFHKEVYIVDNWQQRKKLMIKVCNKINATQVSDFAAVKINS